MKGVTGRAVGFGVLALGAVFGAWILSPLSVSFDSVDAFLLICDHDYVGSACPGAERTGPTYTFRINRTTNEVVSLISTPGVPPSSLGNCTIFDRKNWICRYTDGSGGMMMTGGKVETSIPTHRYVSRLQYKSVLLRELLTYLL